MSEESKLVPFSRARRRPDPARVEEFAAMARRLQQERQSSDIVTTLLRDTPRAQWPFLANRTDLRTAGVLERLGREVEARLDREPREALAIAELATAIADALPENAYPPIVIAQVRAHAWKDRGQALCYLARHDEALEALDRADALLESFGTLGHDLAIIRFVRATTLQHVGRFEESLQFLAECRRVFQGHGDARRHLLCGLAEGALLHRMKRFREARDAYIALLGPARDLNDAAVEADLHHNIAYTCVDLGEFDAVESHLDRSIALFRELGRPIRAANSEAVRGVMFARRGEHARAVTQLSMVRKQMLDHGLVEEAGLFGLEAVQALLSLGAARDAETLARQIVGEFTSAKLNARAIAALGHLSEAIAANTVSTATVGRVRDYIVSLRKCPEREFIASA